MKIIIVWIFLITGSVTCNESFNRQTYPDVGLSVPELIRKYGYPVEEFNDIVTEDKYLLDVIRIPYGKNKSNGNVRPVVLLMHGLMGTCRDYVVMGPEKGLAYLLADEGYDVWLGNNRGTRYSRKHQVLNPDIHRKYWDFSWHEMGVYDIPAILEFIKSVTGQERFAYIGNSQGSTQFYVFAAERPDYNKNITIMAGLPPVAYMGHMYSPIVKMLATNEPFLSSLARTLHVDEFPPKPFNEFLVLANQLLCFQGSALIDLCAAIFFLTGGYDYPQLNQTALYTIFSEGSGGCSVHQLFHYAQNINSGRFREYSYDQARNIKTYGSVYPPDYKIKLITAPIAMYYSDGDWFANTKDVEQLCQDIPNCVHKYKVPLAKFNHYDFVLAVDVVPLVYKDLIQLLNKYNKNVT